MSASRRAHRLGPTSLAIAAACLLFAGSVRGQEQTRTEYVAQADPICAGAVKAGARVMRRLTPLIRQERFREAAAIYGRYLKQVFKPTIRKLARIPRPQDDAATLNRWFGIRWRQAPLSESVRHHLRRGNLPAAVRVNRRVQNLDRRADRLLRPLGFKVCDS